MNEPRKTILVITDKEPRGRIEVSCNAKHSPAEIVFALELLKKHLLDANSSEPRLTIPGMLDTRTLERVAS